MPLSSAEVEAALQRGDAPINTEFLKKRAVPAESVPKVDATTAESAGQKRPREAGEPGEGNDGADQEADAGVAEPDKKSRRGQWSASERKKQKGKGKGKGKDKGGKGKPRGTRICAELAFWNSCPAEKCIRSHDVAKKLKERAEEVSSPPGEATEEQSTTEQAPEHSLRHCIVFAKHGFCPAGVSCVGYRTHTNAEGKNLVRDEETGESVVIERSGEHGDRIRALCPRIQNGVSEENVLSDACKVALRKGFDFSKSDRAKEAVDKIMSTEREAKEEAIKSGEYLKLTDMEVEDTDMKADVSTPQAELPKEVPEGASVDTDENATCPVENAGSSEPAAPLQTVLEPAPLLPNVLKLVRAELEKNVGPLVTSDVQDKVFERKKKIFTLRNKRILAPLTTVGNLPFRRLCVELGAEVTMSEMALAESILRGEAEEQHLLRKHRTEEIYGVQITSGNQDVMVKCAQLIEDEVDCDFIDINAACPLDQLHKKGCGSLLTVRTNVLEKMCLGMKAVMHTKLLTVKTRISHYDHDKKHDALTLYPKLASWGVDAVILHGRTSRQRYSNLANWDYLGKVHRHIQNTTLPLIGCGDVLSYDDYDMHLQEQQCDSVLIGRGALIKPWVFSEIRDKQHYDMPATERLDLLRKYCHYGLEHWGGDPHGVQQTRRFLLEWLSFFHRYIPRGLLAEGHQTMKINWRPPAYVGRNDLETLLASPKCEDWIKISEMFLGKTPEDFAFVPKHKSASYDEVDKN